MLFTFAVTGRIPDAEGKLPPMPKASQGYMSSLRRHQEGTFLESSQEATIGRATCYSSRKGWSIEEEPVWYKRRANELGNSDRGRHAIDWILAS